jgi:hypothetical protein
MITLLSRQPAGSGTRNMAMAALSRQQAGSGTSNTPLAANTTTSLLAATAAHDGYTINNPTTNTSIHEDQYLERKTALAPAGQIVSHHQGNSVGADDRAPQSEPYMQQEVLASSPRQPAGSEQATSSTLSWGSAYLTPQVLLMAFWDQV